MKNIKVFGSCCGNCATTLELIKQIAAEQNVAIELEKVTDLEQIMQAGVMTTPAVSVDGELRHIGSVPTKEQVMALLADKCSCGSC